MPNDIESKMVVEMNNKELQSNLINYAKSLTKCLQSAEDLVQDARRKVREKRETIERNSIGGYLTTIIRNQYINEYRKKKNYPHKNIQENSQRDAIHQEKNRNEVESNFAVKVIKEGIQHVDPEKMAALELWMQGVPYKEISETLTIPEGTVKGRIFHARRDLADYLSKVDPSYKVRQKQTQRTMKKRESST